MLLDHYNDSFHRFRNRLSVISLPFQYLVSVPIDWVNGSFSHWASSQSLLKENAELRAQILLLNAELQKQNAIESDNQQLHILLQSRQQNKHTRMTIAKLLAVSINPIEREIILDKGEQAGVFIGQPVVDAYGVVGQVTRIEPLTSRVMLINDSRSVIPVQIQRNGLRALAEGIDQSPNQLKLNHVMETQDIQVGDLVVTSGLGGRFPLGYPVGKIISVHAHSNEPFADIVLTPSARLNQSRLVLLLWPKEQASAAPQKVKRHR